MTSPSENFSVECQIVCHSTGIFGMRQQSDMYQCVKMFLIQSGASADEAVQHMIDRWREYQGAIPQLDWSHGSSYKFFMSGNWDLPTAWPWKRNKESERDRKVREYEEAVRRDRETSGDGTAV